MLKRELALLDEREYERAQSVARALRDQTFRSGQFRESLLYPELSLTRPYTYCIGSIEAASILPLFQTVIVDLRPIPNAIAFQERYGLSVAQFVSYVEQGRIAMRLRQPFQDFAGLDYLDVLLRSCPPVSRRYIHYYAEQHRNYLEEGRRRCPRGRRSSARWSREYADWNKKPSFRDVFAHKYALVSCYFGQDEANRITDEAVGRTKDPAAAYDWLHIFSRLRVYPWSNCLDGVNTLSVHDWEFARQLNRPFARPLPYEIPSFEVGRAVLLNQPLDLPRDLDKAMAVPPSVWMNAVYALDNALDSTKRDDVGSVCHNITRLAQETRDEVDKMRGRTAAFKRGGATLGGMGIVGGLADLVPEWKFIITGASGAVVALKNILAEAVVKHGKANHVVAWFDLRKRFDSK